MLFPELVLQQYTLFFFTWPRLSSLINETLACAAASPRHLPLAKVSEVFFCNTGHASFDAVHVWHVDEDRVKGTDPSIAGEPHAHC